MKRVLALLVVFGALSGCESYYRITDTESGRQYYTKNSLIKRHRGGAIEFEDMHSFKMVNLQSFEKLQVKKEAAVAGIEPAQGNVASP